MPRPSISANLGVHLGYFDGPAADPRMRPFRELVDRDARWKWDIPLPTIRVLIDVRRRVVVGRCARMQCLIGRRPPSTRRLEGRRREQRLVGRRSLQRQAHMQRMQPGGDRINKVRKVDPTST